MTVRNCTQRQKHLFHRHFLLQLLIGMSMRYYMISCVIFQSIKTAELRTFFVKNKTIMMLDIISYIYLVFDLWVCYVPQIAFAFKKKTKQKTQWDTEKLHSPLLKVYSNRRSSSMHELLPPALTQPAVRVAGNHAASCATQLWVLPKCYEAWLTWMGLCLTISFTSMYSNGGWGKRRKRNSIRL